MNIRMYVGIFFIVVGLICGMMSVYKKGDSITYKDEVLYCVSMSITVSILLIGV